jgi:hypothetical protein
LAIGGKVSAGQFAGTAEAEVGAQVGKTSPSVAAASVGPDEVANLARALVELVVAEGSRLKANGVDDLDIGFARGEVVTALQRPIRAGCIFPR